MPNTCNKPMHLQNKITGKIERVPCGQCRGCRLEKSSQWASRCTHEASLYEKNCFLTLTFAPEHLPKDYSINKSTLKNFIKRLRNHFEQEIRFYACGEYGEKRGRPHYHVLVFNADFPDRELLTLGAQNRLRSHFSKGPLFDLYRSPTLEKLWKYGFSTIGDVTYESAGYCARYIMKKVTGDIDVQADHYNGRVPEFALMSRNPGIGHDWLKKYFNDVYPKDSFHIDGRRKKPPRYYDTLAKKWDPEMFFWVKKKREEVETEDDGLRLYQKDNHLKLTTDKLKRNYENGNE